MNAISGLKRQWDEYTRRVEEDASEQKEAGRVYLIPAIEIVPNRAQPRREFDPAAIARLGDSIRQYGILQPLTVRSDGSHYELIAGERRWRAAQLIGLSEVPCILIDADDRCAAEMAIVENVQREDLNMFEQAAAIAALIDIYHITQEEAARRLSTSQSYVANKLRILRLTAPERELLLRASLSERHARALLRIADPAQRLTALRQIILRGMNVAAAEAYIEKLVSADEKPHTQHRKLILRDIRVFYNTIDRAMSMMREAGIAAESAKREVGDGVELLIRIPHIYS